ncbi:MAG: hypothetical protein ACK415_05845 [Thermodesulfovibrionales bacterium]
MVKVLKSGLSVLSLLTLLTMTVILSGCGSGSDSIDTGLPGGGSSGGGNYHINIISYSIEPTQLKEGTNFRVSWAVDYKGVAGYWVEFHMNSEDSIPANMPALTRHFNYNCEMGPYTCGKSDFVSGTVSGNNTICYPGWTNAFGPQAHTIMFKGNGYAILKACTYDDRMNTLCDQKSVQITVQ